MLYCVRDVPLICDMYISVAFLAPGLGVRHFGVSSLFVEPDVPGPTPLSTIMLNLV